MYLCFLQVWMPNQSDKIEISQQKRTETQYLRNFKLLEQSVTLVGFVHHCSSMKEGILSVNTKMYDFPDLYLLLLHPASPCLLI